MDRYKFLGVLCEKDFTQRKLARSLGVNKGTIHCWLSGKNHIPDFRISQMCDLLELNNPQEIVAIFLPDVSIKESSEEG